MKKKYLITGLLALVLIVSAGVKPALAYFTGTTSASGGQTVKFDFGTTIQETAENLTKTVTLENTGDVDVFVRAHTFVGSQYTLFYDFVGEWKPTEDGWIEYTQPVAPNGTAVFKVTVKGVSEHPENGESVNVAVVYECTPVQYKADGTPYADWSYAFQKTTTPEGGNNG